MLIFFQLLGYIAAVLVLIVVVMGLLLCICLGDIKMNRLTDQQRARLK